MEILSLLLDSNAAVEQTVCTPTGMKFRALEAASSKGHIQCVRLLLDYGAEIETKKDHNTASPLWFACHQNHPAVAHLLLNRGADVDRPVRIKHEDAPMTLLTGVARHTEPPIKALLRKYISMRVRRCVLGRASEHPRRQKARDVVPMIASFIV